MSKYINSAGWALLALSFSSAAIRIVADKGDNFVAVLFVLLAFGSVGVIRYKFKN